MSSENFWSFRSSLNQLPIQISPSAQSKVAADSSEIRRRPLRLSLPGRSPVAGVGTLSHARQWDAVFLFGMRRRSVDSLQRTAGQRGDGRRRRAAPAYPARHGPPLPPRWASRDAWDGQRGEAGSTCLASARRPPRSSPTRGRRPAPSPVCRQQTSHARHRAEQRMRSPCRRPPALTREEYSEYRCLS